MMFIIISKRKLEARVEREAEIRAGEILGRYADNPTLLRKAAAAWHDVDVESLDRVTKWEASALNPAIRRALRAAAQGLAEERAEVGRA